MTTKTKSETKFVISYADGCGCSDVISETEVLRRVNEERTCYINDEVDPEYIEENFPTDIKDLSMARKWLDGTGNTLCEVPEKLGESHRILKRMYELNGQITGRIKRKEYDYNDQGYWNFTIKILDLDEDMRATLQIKADKMCPSGAWDNGVYVAERPQVTLYEFVGDIDMTVRQIINRYFRSDRGNSGKDYRIIRFAL